MSKIIFQNFATIHIYCICKRFHLLNRPTRIVSNDVGMATQPRSEKQYKQNTHKSTASQCLYIHAFLRAITTADLFVYLAQTFVRYDFIAFIYSSVLMPSRSFPHEISIVMEFFRCCIAPVSTKTVSFSRCIAYFDGDLHSTNFALFSFLISSLILFVYRGFSNNQSQC